MSRIASLFLTAAISFILGLCSAVGAYWFLKTYLFPPTTIAVRGVIKYQAQPSDPSASGNPPNGYFVESSATERFYVEGDRAKPYVGSLVSIQGTLSTVCGPDAFPCYPKLVPESIAPAPGGQ